MTKARRIQHVGVKMTPCEAEALRVAAFEERTSKSSLMRRLFLEYLKRQEKGAQSGE